VLNLIHLAQRTSAPSAAAAAAAAMRPHPQRVMPLGNQYLVPAEEAARSRRARAHGLGAMAVLSDQLLLRVLGGDDDDVGVDGRALAVLAAGPGPHTASPH